MIDKEREVLESIYNQMVKLLPNLAANISFTDLLSYCTMIESRQFNITLKGANVSCHVPYGEFINCSVSGKENATWDYDPETQCLQYRAVRNLSKGDQVVGFVMGRW